MQAWTAAELGRFLGRADARDREIVMGWRLLAATGVRRGEGLALRWRASTWLPADAQCAAASGSSRREGGGAGDRGADRERALAGDRPRFGTISASWDYRATRGLLALDLVRDSPLVLGELDGDHRHPERFSRRFTADVAHAREALGPDRRPAIRLHDP